MQRILAKDTSKKVGEKVTLAGWVQTRRDHGKLVFLDLRDHSGIVQIVFKASKEVDPVRPEWVVKIEGEVKERPKSMKNPELQTGSVEVAATKLTVLSKAKPLPFDIETDGYEVAEEKRLKYRYLDIRRKRLQKTLALRHRLLKFTRDFMDEKGFVEIETPLLTKSTPEGARDYVVPSRVNPGTFYALPQSPQQYKELLMVGGIEKYFQIARALRDEDPRADRQPEHTQLDLEMAFVEQEDVMNLVEEWIIKLTEFLEPLTGKRVLSNPLPRLTYKEAIKKYGSDKPDIRTDKEKEDPNVLAFAWVTDFPLVEWSKKEKRWDPVHHMFVLPKSGQEKLLDTDPGKVISTQYDLVCNGYELCSGSLRIHTRELQEKVMQLIGLDLTEARKQFGHLLEAFEYGAPPHGGAAPGIDRLTMLYANEPNIREVIAFPKTGDGRDLMMDAPSEISPAQLKELHLEIKKPASSAGAPKRRNKK